MDITINAVAFTPEHGVELSSAPEGTIKNYDGSPLFCHITQRPDGKTVDVLFNQTAPDEFGIGPNGYAKGQIASVTVQFAKDYAARPDSTLTWTPPESAVYSGGPTNPYLEFEADLKSATLVLPNPHPHDPLQPIPTFAIFYLGPEITYGNPRAYFINVPLYDVPRGTKDPRQEQHPEDNPRGPERVDYRSYTWARLSWSKDSSMAGPIGQANVPG